MALVITPPVVTISTVNPDPEPLEVVATPDPSEYPVPPVDKELRAFTPLALALVIVTVSLAV